MKTHSYRFFLLIVLLVLTSLACRTFASQPATPVVLPTAITRPTPTAVPLPAAPVKPGAQHPDEPALITGDIPYTSPFFLNSISQPFVLLEDEAGFIRRDRQFKFSLAGQVIGPVVINDDKSLSYSLALPVIPQGTLVDVDNDEQQDSGVQVFAIAYWSNTWGDPFSEERDGSGWSTAYVSTITDAENDDEIVGGILVVWAPDDQQSFPTGFGQDGKLFTSDDPIGPIPSGYNLVDLSQAPFLVYKEAQPRIMLNEGDVAVNDFSQMSYVEAFQALFDKASLEYPFTVEKGIDWQALKDEFMPRFEAAKNNDDFYRVLRDFAYRIPDGHVNVSFNAQVFYEERSGGLGLVLAELSDGRALVTQVLPGAPGEKAGIKPGAEIITWQKQPVAEAIAAVTPYLGPYSTEHTRRIEQVNFLTRMASGERVELTYKNPGEKSPASASLQAVSEYDSFFATIPAFDQDELALPVESWIMDESEIGYIRVNTFSDDYNLMASLWNRALQGLVDQEIPALVIDLRSNSGGSLSMALDFAGYFFDKEFELYRGKYYNEESGTFEYVDQSSKVKPGPLLFKGPLAVLVSPNCVSACEGFAYTLRQDDRAIIVGHYPTAGAFGEVGRGQYKLPGDITMQFPTGRPETMDGKLLIEGTGVPLDIQVSVTEESVLDKVDAVLDAAVQALLDQIQ